MSNIPKRSRFANFSADEFEREKQGIQKEIMARLTRGNIPTQQGRFTTQAELEAMRDAIAADLKASGYVRH